MATLKESVADVVRVKLRVLKMDESLAETVFVEEIEQVILNYCNISEVPEALKFTWANMVIDYLAWTASSPVNGTGTSKPGGSSSATVLSSIKEGDTTLGFSVDTNDAGTALRNAHSFKGALDQITLNYQEQLNKFRKVVW